MKNIALILKKILQNFKTSCETSRSLAIFLILGRANIPKAEKYGIE